MKTIITAGGKGTRIASLAGDIPKPMIPISGKPVLEHEINCLKSQGFDDIIITVSHMAECIMNHFGDGSKFGVRLDYFVESEPLGNAGALFRLRDKLGDDFLLVNADVMFDVNLSRFVDFHARKHALVTLFTHPNDHPFDSGLVVADENCAVTQWLTKEAARPEFYKNRVNAGLHVINNAALDMVTQHKDKIDLDRDILRPLCQTQTGRVFCYDSSEYVKDMGTPERYIEVCHDFESGKIQARNLTRRQKAIFLDRDGTINQYRGFIRNPDEIELLPGASGAIRRINQSEYLAIVITNQPVIARGEVSPSGLEAIHNKLETLLGLDRAYLDAIYYCPHHPDKGFEGEIPELKIDCPCRKPKPGMLIQAARDFNIDLASSWMVGDSENDILAGKAAGCNTARIGQDMTLLDVVNRIFARGKISRHVDELISRYPKLEACREEILRAYDIMEDCYSNGKKLLIAGNGGSAADCEHMSGELMKRFKLPRPVSPDFAEKLKAVDAVMGPELAEKLEQGLTAVPLVAHEALSTAYINDVDGLGVFAQQLFVFGRKGDAFIAISTSGNSQNVIRAAVTARAMGIRVIALTGDSGGRLAALADVVVKVPESETYMIQELHLPVYHCWCQMLEERFFGPDRITRTGTGE